MRNNNITLVNLRIFGSKIIKYSGLYTPLGSLYIAGYLEERGYCISFLDYNPKEFNQEQIIADIKEILNNSAHLIMFSVIFTDLPILLPIVNSYKKNNNSKKIILGGPGVTAIGSKIIQRFPCIDAVIEGEGEVNVLNTINSCLGNTANNNFIYKTKEQERLDFNRLPIPAYHLLSNDKYKIACISSTRGCCFSCSFCSIPTIWGRQIKCRDIVSFVDEIELLHSDYGIDHFSITDDVFIISKDRVYEFCNELTKRKLDIKWDCFGKIELFDPYLIAIMNMCGLDYIYYGVESGSDKVLRKIGKTFNIQSAIKVVEATTKICSCTASFIWGFPFENKKEFKLTVDLMNYFSSLENIKIQNSSVCILPGTAMYKNYHSHMSFDESYIPNVTGYTKEDVFAYKDFITQNCSITTGFQYVNNSGLEYKVDCMRAEGYLN